MHITPETTAKVETREQFCEFVSELVTDLRTNPDGWENNDLESFLNALVAYGCDLQGFYNNMSIDVDADQSSWRVFADLLAGARVYE